MIYTLNINFNIEMSFTEHFLNIFHIHLTFEDCNAHRSLVCDNSFLKIYLIVILNLQANWWNY